MKDNKKWIIGIIVLLAIIGVVIYFLFFRNTNNTPESDYNPSRISYNTVLAEDNNSNTNSNSVANSINSNNFVFGVCFTVKRYAARTSPPNFIATSFNLPSSWSFASPFTAWTKAFISYFISF